MAWQDTRPYQWRMGNLYHVSCSEVVLIVGNGRIFVSFFFFLLSATLVVRQMSFPTIG